VTEAEADRIWHAARAELVAALRRGPGRPGHGLWPPVLQAAAYVVLERRPELRPRESPEGGEARP
jgi:hypothetical protein